MTVILLGGKEKPRILAPGQATPSEQGDLSGSKARSRELPSGLSSPGRHRLGPGARVPIHPFPLPGLQQTQKLASGGCHSFSGQNCAVDEETRPRVLTDT